MTVCALALVACGGGRDNGTGTGGNMNMGLQPDGGVDGASLLSEQCNGSDDDLDSVVDEGCGCQADSSQMCFPGPVSQNALERCQLGVQECTNDAEFGAWSTCTGWKQCEIIEQQFVYGEEENIRAVDIVMVIDQSGSMSDEIAAVKTNLNTFSTTLVNSGIDFHFILVAERGTGTYDMCVPQPLGGPSCADTATFKQVDVNVQSEDSLYIVQQNIAAIESFMRPGSLRVLIEVSDDTPQNWGGTGDALTGMAFQSFISVRPGWEDYVFHSVVGDGTCPGEAAAGVDYTWLSMQTGGIIERICTPDWSKTFQNVASNIISRTLLYELQEEPYDVVGLDFVDPASGTRIPQKRGLVWDYNPENNSVTLFDGFTPSNGTKLIVQYRRIAKTG
ncbi:MAG: VWA domain-containing protein [Myxococcales bacterium]|nr:VWA domain-containing protein [Myxococcales bacterium]